MTKLKRFGLLCGLFFCLGLMAHAQLPTCTVSGTIYKPTGGGGGSVPAAYTSIYIVRVVKDDALISSEPVKVTSNFAGVVTFIAIRSSDTYVRGPVVGLDVTVGKRLRIPDAPTADLGVLIPNSTIPPDGLTTKEDGMALANKALDINFTTRLNATDSPAGQTNVAVDVAGLITDILPDLVTAGNCTACNLTVDAKGRITALANGSGGNVTSVAGRIGAVVLTKTDVGLGNVDNTTDAGKPVSTAQAAANTAEATARANADALLLVKGNNLSDVANAATARSNIGAGTGNGSVTSVGLTVPGIIFSIAGSPITTSGTLSFSLLTQAANTVFAGPTSGGASTPTFRSLVATDIPPIDLTTKVTGILPVANGGTGQTSLTDLPLLTPKITTGLKDANGNSMFLYSPTASAVNQLTITNSIAANNPKISATGSDTNLDVEIIGKGAGGVLLKSGGTTYITASGGLGIRFNVAAAAVSDSGNSVFRLTGNGFELAANTQLTFAQSNNAPYDTKDAGLGRNGVGKLKWTNGSSGVGGTLTTAASSANYLDLSSAAVSAAPTISAVGSDTNIDIRLVPKGTGIVDRPFEGVKVTSTANQTIPTGSTTAVVFDSEGNGGYDTNAFHDTATNNTRIVFVRAGYYSVTCSVTWAANANGTRTLYLRKNGAGGDFVDMIEADIGIGGRYVQRIVSTHLYAANDYIELLAFQSSGGNLDLVNMNATFGSTYKTHPTCEAVWQGR